MDTRTESETAADRERDTLEAQRRAARFATLGQPRPVLVVAARPRPEWVAPPIQPRPRRAPRSRSAKPAGQRSTSTHRRVAAPGKCSICTVRDVKPPREMRGRNAGKIKIHKTCQPCIDERVEYKKRKRAPTSVAA